MEKWNHGQNEKGAFFSYFKKFITENELGLERSSLHQKVLKYPIYRFMYFFYISWSYFHCSI